MPVPKYYYLIGRAVCPSFLLLHTFSSLMHRILTAFLTALLLAAGADSALAQHDHHHHHEARIIDFPDVPGYLTLKTDLHIHTVFSDGSVWPDIRVEEAQRDGLDAIAMTDHLEYQPHRDDIPHPDRNRSYQVAVQEAEGSDLIVINGSEITRQMPPGHSNAVFIEDANPLLQDDVMAVFREARRQGAFIFWNHPAWTAQAPTGVAALTDLHRELIAEGLLNGIEVVNEHSYSDEALQIALDNDLTIMGTSDVHGLIDWMYDVPHGHRPVTLVFATERTAEALKEGLMESRTAVWFDDMLIGREEWLVPLITASVTVDRAAYQGESAVLDVYLENVSDADFTLRSLGDYGFHAHANLVRVRANGTTRLQVKTLERMDAVSLPFEVMNAVTAPGDHPVVTFEVAVAGD